ncbi:MAG: peroxiredoxin [Candidatus Nanohaloarchaea archaeon]
MKEGDNLPRFEVENQDGEEVFSKDIQDAVIYFYPKASTPGCTTEACNFRDSIEKFNDSDLQVYGVSTDTIDAQKKFHENQELNFDLLADHDKEVSKKFGVLKDTGTAERTTFLVRDGKVEKVFRKVSPSKHIDEVIEYIED